MSQRASPFRSVIVDEIGNDAAEITIKQVELSSAISELRAYRAQAQAEIERVDALEADLLKRLKQLLDPGNKYALEGAGDDDLKKRVSETTERRSVWGRVRDAGDAEAR